MKITKYKTKNRYISSLQKKKNLSIEIINYKMKESLEIFLCIFIIKHFE